MTEKSVTEASNDFYLEFKSEYQAIDLEIERSNTLLKANLTTHFSNVLQRINNLQKNLTKATEFIPSYDERQYFSQLKDLSQKLEAAKAELTPKAKFSFKSRKKKTDTDVVNKKVEQVQTKASQEEDVLSNATVLLKDKENTILRLSDNQNAKLHEKNVDVLLSNLKDCIIMLEQKDVQISAIHIKKVEGCVIYCGQVDGSVLIYGIKNSTLFVGCHQLRMHEAYQVNMMLHVTSRPIIEDSDQVRVGEWNMNSTTNYYDQFEDFNWLKKQASPHWSILSQEDQKTLNDNVDSIKDMNDSTDIVPKKSILLLL